MENLINIYELSDPRDQQPRYIGYTKKTIEDRLDEHLKEKNKNHKVNWIKSLKKDNIIPYVRLIESVLNGTHKFWEKYKASSLDDIKLGVKNEELFPIAFYDEKGTVLFYSIVDFYSYSDGVHVHALCGNILRLASFISEFFCGLALHRKKSRVTFCTKRTAIEKAADKLGYAENAFGDFEKRIA